jgi:endonuclease YncB( thermonuclease family)
VRVRRGVTSSASGRTSARRPDGAPSRPARPSGGRELRRLRRLPIAFLVAVAVAASPAAAADAARRAPCVPGTNGPMCHVWVARVTFVADGDTIRADIGGDGTRAVRTIRLTGINAMELTRYSRRAARRAGDCHAVAATAVVERWIRRGRARGRLAAQHPRSRSGGRLRRSVHVRVGGAWHDLARKVLDGGLALWLPNRVESVHNREYHRAADRAARARRGLFDPAACGVGPDQDVGLHMLLNWDADGDDAANLNGEWVRIRNTGPRDVSLAGWSVRDSSLVRTARRRPGFVFPAYAVIPAGGDLTLHVGCGANGPATPTVLYWCRPSPLFENVVSDGSDLGDGGYLFDPQGDLRASSTYPCIVLCSDPLLGRVRIAAHPRSPESIDVTNVSDTPVDLDGHVLKVHVAGRRDAFVLSHLFGPGTALGPGETLEVRTQGSPSDDERLRVHMGRPGPVLADAGNAVSLRSLTDVVVDCYAWGSGVY